MKQYKSSPHSTRKQSEPNRNKKHEKKLHNSLNNSSPPNPIKCKPQIFNQTRGKYQVQLENANNNSKQYTELEIQMHRVRSDGLSVFVVTRFELFSPVSDYD